MGAKHGSNAASAGHTTSVVATVVVAAATVGATVGVSTVAAAVVLATEVGPNTSVVAMMVVVANGHAVTPIRRHPISLVVIRTLRASTGLGKVSLVCSLEVGGPANTAGAYATKPQHMLAGIGFSTGSVRLAGVRVRV